MKTMNTRAAFLTVFALLLASICLFASNFDGAFKNWMGVFGLIQAVNFSFLLSVIIKRVGQN